MATLRLWRFLTSKGLGSFVGTLLTVALVLSARDATARPPEHAYVAFGVGYAAVSGERGVPLKPSSEFSLSIAPSSSLYDETVRSEFGEGMSLELRFGFRVGPIAPELVMFGHGTFDFENGAGYPMFQLRFHPLLLVDSLADWKVDGSIYAAGYAIGGYHHEGDDDGKGWEGWVFAFGLAGSYELSPRVHLLLDLKFTLPQYLSWIFSREDDITFEPGSTPSTLIIAPSLQIQAYF